MSEKFVASNGVEIERDGELFMSNNGECRSDYIYGAHEMALREFFQHERDEELGRWRWPEEPDYLVYPLGDGRVDVLRESPVGGSFLGPGRLQGIGREGADAWDSDAARNFYAAARAYFEAHPEPKPWHEAKNLEIWVLTIQGCAPEAYIYRREFAYHLGGFRPVNHEDRIRFEKNDQRISNAHRIWPEGDAA